MAQLRSFSSLEEKSKLFSNKLHVTINTKEDFDAWFNYYASDIKDAKKTDFIFRGMGEAKHKLYTSAQRLWIQNDMKEWAGNYISFIANMVNRSKNHPLLKKVFDIYGYDDQEREFPLLSILQHYWAPTPLMDWTYNINVALFFATENTTCGNGNSSIDNYFSIYRINKAKYRNEFLNLTDFDPMLMSGLSSFRDWSDAERNENANSIFYLSDFDEGNAIGTTPNSVIQVNPTHKPLTSIYNQNIIPQEGLFIFNPFSQKTIDDIFNTNLEGEGWNLQLTPFSCFNIKKDLSEYIRRHIRENYSLQKPFIYPHLYDDVDAIKNQVLDNYAKK